MFHEGDGQDTIEDFGLTFLSYNSVTNSFEPSGRKVIQLRLNVADDTSDEAAFESLKIRQDGRDTVIGYGDAGDTITLLGTSVGTLTIDDFVFVA